MHIGGEKRRGGGGESVSCSTPYPHQLHKLVEDIGSKRLFFQKSDENLHPCVILGVLRDMVGFLKELKKKRKKKGKEKVIQSLG